MKDLDQQLIFEQYQQHQERMGKIQYLRENFEDGAKNFESDDSDSDSDTKSDSDSDTKSDSDSDTKSDSDSDTKPDTESKSDSDSDTKSSSSSDSSSSNSSSSSSKSSGEAKVEKGKMTEEELDTELDALMAKKDKIQKLFKDQSIDEEAAQQALDKIKSITNQLVAKFI